MTTDNINQNRHYARLSHMLKILHQASDSREIS